MRPGEETFHAWYSSRGSGSGPGSHPSFTSGYRAFLERFLVDHDVRSILDYGCGDWRSSRLIAWGARDYLGVDIVPHLVAWLRSTFGAPNRRFELIDPDTWEAPYVDLVLCKDVLQHLPTDEARALCRELSAKGKHVLFIDDRPVGRSTANTDCRRGEYRPIELSQAPFELRGRDVFWFPVADRVKRKGAFYVGELVSGNGPSAPLGASSRLEDEYERLAATAHDGDTLVHVGIGLGDGLALLGERLVRHRKNVRLIAVDAWANVDDYGTFLQGMLARGPREGGLLHIWRMSSDEAARALSPSSCRAVILSGGEQTPSLREELGRWVQRVEPGGLMVGRANPADPLVGRTLRAAFARNGYTMRGGVWATTLSGTRSVGGARLVAAHEQGVTPAGVPGGADDTRRVQSAIDKAGEDVEARTAPILFGSGHLRVRGTLAARTGVVFTPAEALRGPVVFSADGGRSPDSDVPKHDRRPDVASTQEQSCATVDSSDAVRLIPRIFHTVWPGYDEFRPKFHPWRVTWVHHHPDATFLFHRLDVPESSVERERVMAVMGRQDLSVVVKADVLRYAVVEALGGVYVDADMECLRPVDALLTSSRGFMIRADVTAGPAACHLDPIFLAAVAHHPATQRLLRHALQAVEETPATICNGTPNVVTGPSMCSRALRGMPEIDLCDHATFSKHHENGQSALGWTRRTVLG